jgi:DNA-binding XRE family transcriptional regulator
MGKTKVELTPEQAAKLAEARGKAAATRHLDEPPFAGTGDEPIRFFTALQAAIGRLKSARESAGLTLKDVSEKSGIAVETLSRMETGAARNPTWKTLGDYAHAVGVRLTLGVEG